MCKGVLALALLLALVLASWPSAVHADGPPTVHDVASELMCQCGCGLTVAVCQESMACSVADGIVQEIQRQIDAGKGKQEILDYFVVVYGEQVLALPRKSGFSLTAWTIPFLAVAAGAVVISLLAWLWVRRRPAPIPEEAPPTSAGELSRYQERVDEDLRYLNEGPP